MKRMIAMVLTAGFMIAIMGCSQAPVTEAAGQPTTASATQDDHAGHDHDHDHAGHDHAGPEPATATPSGEKVEVAAKGTTFDPPVGVEQMPTGAWACVMSKKVHYASMEEGDGKCDICKMKLIKQ